ncbi:MAG: hypothetical protein ACTSXD_12010 [Candidatus Heimdallarchaeaceae archaeon]
MKLEDMDIKELKVLAYDTLASIQNLQQNMNIINNLIIQKQNKLAKVPEKKEKKEK